MPTEYAEGYLVIIKKTQFVPESKLKAKFLGPYRVLRIKRNHRYKVICVRGDEGLRIITTLVDFMKGRGNSSETEE